MVYKIQSTRGFATGNGTLSLANLKKLCRQTSRGVIQFSIVLFSPQSFKMQTFSLPLPLLLIMLNCVKKALEKVV